MPSHFRFLALVSPRRHPVADRSLLLCFRGAHLLLHGEHRCCRQYHTADRLCSGSHTSCDNRPDYRRYHIVDKQASFDSPPCCLAGVRSTDGRRAETERGKEGYEERASSAWSLCFEHEGGMQVSDSIVAAAQSLGVRAGVPMYMYEDVNGWPSSIASRGLRYKCV